MCICWCVTEINYKTHGATIKILKSKFEDMRIYTLLVLWIIP